MKKVITDIVVTVVLGSWALLAYETTYNLITDPFTQTITEFTPQVRAGENIAITYDVNRKWVGCTIRVERYISPNLSVQPKPSVPTEILLQSGVRYVDTNNTHSKVSDTMVVPKTVLPGKYLFYSRYSYNCNLAQNLFGPSVRVDTVLPIEILE